jgi:hypothetical protein
MRLAEARPVDVLSAAILADAVVPALYGAITDPLPLPTIELALHFAPAVAAPEPSGWVLGVFRTRLAAAGYAVEDGELWDRRRRLLLTARQLRRALPRAG